MNDQVKGLIFIQLEDLPCVSVKELYKPGITDEKYSELLLGA